MLKTLHIQIAVLILLASCSIKDSDVEPDFDFTKTYYYAEINEEFHPQSIVQTSDEGFLIQASILMYGTESFDTDNTFKYRPYLLKVDKYGEFEWENKFGTYYNSVPGLLETIGGYAFTCMDEQQKTVFIRTDEAGNNEQFGSPEDRFPLAVHQRADGNILLQNFDQIKRHSILKLYDQNLNPIWTGDNAPRAEIIGNVEHHIINHYNHVGDELPFFVGETGNSIYMNCFRNYTFSLVFFNADRSQTGRVSGFTTLGAVNSFTPLPSAEALFSYYYSDNTYLAGPTAINEGSATEITDYDKTELHELHPRSIIKTLEFVKGENTYHLLAGTTKSNKIIIYFFDEAGTLTYTHYITDTNPLQIADLKRTADDGLILLVKTFLSGKYPRIMIKKVNKEHLAI